MDTSVERWTALINAWAQQMDAAYARLGRTSADYWDRRARWFHRSTKESAAGDPFFLKVCSELTPETSVLDVGAGTGRFSLALAPLVRQMIAVEPNAAMLDYLCRDAREEGLTNITSLQTTWQDAPGDLCADVVICSHVLYPIADIVPFLGRLHAATRRACYIYMRATPFDAITNHLWKHFHGEERCYPPSYIHVLDVLYEMGIYANVEVINLPANLQSLQYSSLDAAVDRMVEQLILPGDEQTRRELQGLLAQWLVERDGVLMPPVEKMVCAIIWWTPQV